MGGRGFNYKWNMGWMNDMLKYMSLDPIYRKWNHDKVTFSFMYAFSENFVLPLSHDEVVHGKCSLIGKMPGDYWQKFANLRAFFGYWMAHPGKKLLFMGGEFGQFIEWKYDDSLDWHLVQKYPMHTKMLEYSRALNKFYCENKALWQVDFDWNGFQWIDPDDNENSVISFIRKAEDGDDFLIAVCNFTPEVRHGYRIGVPMKGVYYEVFNSDDEAYGGSGVKNGDLASEDVPWHNRSQSIALTVPPLATVYLRLRGTAAAGRGDAPVHEEVEAKGEGKEASEAKTVAAAAKPKRRTAAKTTKSAKATRTVKTAKSAKTTAKTAKKRAVTKSAKPVAEEKTAGAAVAKKAAAKDTEKKTRTRTTRKKAADAGETEAKKPLVKRTRAASKKTADKAEKSEQTEATGTTRKRTTRTTRRNTAAQAANE